MSGGRSWQGGTLGEWELELELVPGLELEVGGPYVGLEIVKTPEG